MEQPRRSVRRQAEIRAVRPAIRVEMLGGFTISVAGHGLAEDGWRRRKARQLLKCLLAHPRRRVSRDLLIGWLWPDSAPDAARITLRSTLHALRGTLEAAGLERLANLIVVDRDGIGLAPTADLWVDADAFDQLLSAAAEADDPLPLLEEADALYAGELLPDDRYEAWAGDRREALRRRWVELQLQLARHLERQGGPDSAAAALGRLLDADPADERAGQALIRLWLRHGRRADASRAHRALVDAVRAHLGVEPSDDTTALGRELNRPSAGPESGAMSRGGAPPRRHNLPAQTTPLVGREGEVAYVRDLLLRDDVRLVTLTGAGGVGKTRVGLQVAADLLDDLPDGVSFVPLAAVDDPALVTSTIAQALGLVESGARSITDTLKGYLRRRRLLLVLDNFEQLLPAAPLVAELLADCPMLKMLLTSRAVLHLRGEHEVVVPPLALPDPRSGRSVDAVARYGAIHLFVERAASARSDFSLTEDNAADVAEICRRLDGLPLAIELAAARMKMFSPKTLLARLQPRLSLLAGGPIDLPTRQQTMRDTIAWSYGLLDEAERQLFCQLSVFISGFTFDAAIAVSFSNGGSTWDVQDRVASLVDKSLLRLEDVNDEPRFTMLETIREYALEQLREAGDDALLRNRHLAFYVAFAEDAAPRLFGADAVLWLERLTAEHDNLRAALSWSLADPASRVGPGLDLAVALWNYWFHRNHLSEGRHWLERLIGGDVPAGLVDGDRGRTTENGAGQVRWADDEGGVRRSIQRRMHPRAAAFNGLAQFAYHQAEIGQSDRYAREALELARGAGDSVGAAHALTQLGNNARLRNELDLAVSLHTESLSLLREAGDPNGAMRPLLNLGSTVSVTGDYERARQLLEEALATARAMGYPWGIAMALYSLGRMSYGQRSFDQAASLLEESVDWWQRAGATRGPHWSLELLGRIAIAQGNPKRATTYFLESLSFCRDAGDRAGSAGCLAGLASVSAAHSREGHRQNVLRAVRLYGASLALYRSIDARPSPVDFEQIPQRDRVMAAARTHCGDAEIAAAWEEGRTMTLEQAIAYALEGPGSG